MMTRLRYVWERARRLAARTDDLDQKVAFLNEENIRLNQLIRDLIATNRLTRSHSTSASFHWQWGHLPSGEAMPSNQAFLDDAPALLAKMCDRPPEWFQGKRVLDAGCGTGRWSYALCRLGANVLSVDQSEDGLRATAALCQAFPAHRTQRVDLLTLALPESFDLVWCFGVCHHTSDLLTAMRNVMACVANGGQLFMMLYGYPVEPHEFGSHALYESWRHRLAPLSFDERVAALRAAFPTQDLHGLFDAMSPEINDLVTWEWVQTFLREHGFTGARRTINHGNHHFVATKTS